MDYVACCRRCVSSNMFQVINDSSSFLSMLHRLYNIYYLAHLNTSTSTHAPTRFTVSVEKKKTSDIKKTRSNCLD